MSVPQFGEPEPGKDYPDRPAAFAIVENDGKIALVHVHFEGGGRTDLPGGGLDPGETPEQAASRECGEEAGLVVDIGDLVTCADHYFVNEKGETRNTRGRFYAGRLVREDADRKIEGDHELVWVEPLEALRRLDRESHLWAVTAWIRARG